jgi:predicted AAA+ superfamily ATPase
MLFDTSTLKRLAERAESLLTRVETLLPKQAEPDWNASVAFRWRRRPTAFGWQSWLQPVRHRATIALEDLQNIDEPRRLIERNTRRFVQGLPANNVLLTGSRGTGKSSPIKACLNAHAHEGLRLIEVDKSDLVDLPDIVDLVGDRPEKFIVYCDDLSFEEGEAGYKALKTALDGSIAAASDNVLIYATSNRRHLMPERMSENLAAKHTEDGDPSGRDLGGEDLAVGALRAVGRVLPVPPGRLPRGGRALAAPLRLRRRAGRGRARRRAALGARARLALGARRVAVRARLGGRAAGAEARRGRESGRCVEGERCREGERRVEGERRDACGGEARDEGRRIEAGRAGPRVSAAAPPRSASCCATTARC